MPKVTEHQLTLQQSSIISVYQSLEQTIFELFVNRLSKGMPADDATPSDMLQWQIARLSELHLLNNETIDEVSKATGIAREQLTTLFKTMGYDYAQGEYKRLGDATGRPVEPNNIDALMNGFLKQTFSDLDNNVNQTLLSTNYGESPATNTYQQIVKEATARAISGVQTPRRSIADTVYKWRQKGLNMGLIDKGGHHWGLAAYARMVIGTTTHRAYQAVRDQAADDYGIDIFLMTSHPAAREACAPIQGKLVTTRAEGFVIKSTDERVYALVDFGYGTPAGTFGINCRHQKWAYVPGVNTNNQPQYDVQDAVANSKIQLKQRALERQIVKYKQQLSLARELHDEVGVTKYSALVRNNQASVRALVKEHKFLQRDYSREKVYTQPTGQSKSDYINRWQKSAVKKLGSHGLPSENEFKRLARQNGHDANMLRRYLEARSKRTIEPVAGFELFKSVDDQLTKTIHGIKTANGMIITGHSIHSVERVIGTKKYTDPVSGKDKRREGVSIDAVHDALTGGKITVDSKRYTVTFDTSQCNVVVNQDGSIVTIIPHRKG